MWRKNRVYNICDNEIYIRVQENVRTWKMEVSGDQKIGRPKLRWSDAIQKYMKEAGVQRAEVQDQRTGGREGGEGRHEGGGSTESRSTRPENWGNEKLQHRPQIGRRLKKKSHVNKL